MSEFVPDLAACRASFSARTRRARQAREARRQQAAGAARAAAVVVLPRFPAVRRAYLFGSTIRADSPRSPADVDVAIEGDLSAEGFFALWRALEEAMAPWPVDLLDLSAETPFAARVRQCGEVLYDCR